MLCSVLCGVLIAGTASARTLALAGVAEEQGNSRVQHRTSECTTNSKVLCDLSMSDGYTVSCGNATIAIDRWNAKDAAAYFLTHMHADHYKGLHDEWCRGVIYCSEVTRLLLLRKWPTLRNRVKCLVVDDTVTIHLAQQELVSVTLIDANHCPVGHRIEVISTCRSGPL